MVVNAGTNCDSVIVQVRLSCRPVKKSEFIGQHLIITVGDVCINIETVVS